MASKLPFHLAGSISFLVCLAVLKVGLAAERGSDGWTCRELTIPADNTEHEPPVITGLALHPEGRMAAVAGDDHCIRLLDLRTGGATRPLGRHSDWVRSLAFSPTGTVLASAASDGQIMLWDVQSGVRLALLAHLRHPITRIGFSHDGSRLAAVGFGEAVYVFDVERREPEMRLSSPCCDMRALAFSTQSKRIAAGGRNGLVRLWSLADGPLLREFAAHTRRIRGLAFSPDGSALVSCGEDGTIRVTQLDGDSHFVLNCPGAKIMSLAFCGPDLLATGGSDNLIRIWNVNQRSEVAQLTGHTGSVVALAYSGSTLVSSGYDTTVRVWKQSQQSADAGGVSGDRVGARAELEFERP